MIHGQTSKKVQEEFSLDLVENLSTNSYDAVVLTVAHNEYLDMDLRSYLKEDNSILYDVKGILPKEIIDARL